MPTLKWANKALFSVYLATLLAIVASVAVVHSYQAQTTDDGAEFATYSHGILRVSIPYQTERAGAGQLIIDILDPETVKAI